MTQYDIDGLTFPDDHIGRGVMHVVSVAWRNVHDKVILTHVYTGEDAQRGIAQGLEHARHLVDICGLLDTHVYHSHDRKVARVTERDVVATEGETTKVEIMVYMDGLGALVTYDTAETLRRATAGDRRASDAAGDTGAFRALVSRRTLQARAPRLARQMAGRA